MKTRVLSAVLFSILCVGFVGWRVHVHAYRATPHFVVVEDPSLSHPGGCESVLGLAEQSLNGMGTSKDSTLTILVLGDASTANEPWRLARYSFPVTNKVIEGKTASTRRQAELFSDIQSKCEAIRRTSVSPIFLGVKQAIADLRAHGCTVASHCRVFVDSDLEENAEISIKDALNRTRNMKISMPTPLDNQGVEVSFCGFAVTAGRAVSRSGREIERPSLHDQSRDDRLRMIWRSLFAEPEIVKFEPYCPTIRSETGSRRLVGLSPRESTQSSNSSRDESRHF